MKQADGTVVEEGKIGATRSALAAWLEPRRVAWVGAMEATLFTGWIYDFLHPHAVDLKVGHPLKLRAIVAGKKKSDRLDARTLADLLRCDLFPQCYRAAEPMRELRRVLRYRTLLVQEATRLKNKTAGLLMEVGAQYDKERLHGRRYFEALLGRIEDVPPSVIRLLRLSREAQEIFERNQRWLVDELRHHPDLKERVERRETLGGVGEVTALTWVLEGGEPERFSCIKEAVSYCGLCSGHHESAGKVQREPVSKQRHKHLQTIWVEAAKLAPRWNAQWAAVYDRDRERARGADPNQATLAVARKLVAYLLYVDKNAKPFEVREAA